MQTARPPDAAPQTLDLYDYFHWAAVTAPATDISTPVPLGAVDDHRPDAADARVAVTPAAEALGAWYPFSHGLDTAVGNALFADQKPSPTRRRVRPRGADSEHLDDDDDDDDDAAHHHRGALCSVPCPHCSQCLTSHRGISSPCSPSTASLRSLRSRHSASSSDSALASSDDECEHADWDQLLNPCFVSTLRPPSPHLPPNGVHPTMEEITAEMAAGGVDVQGIPWDTLPFSRTDYRATRLADQNRTRDSLDVPDGFKYLLKEPRRGAQFFDFFSNARDVKCSIVHFQLRNLAWATSKHDVHVMHDASVMHWDAATKRKTLVLDLSGSDTATASGLGMVQISTMIAKDDLVIAGGFYGEMVAKNMRTGSIMHNKRITFHENAITNAIDIFDNTIMTSNNDKFVRCFDMETFARKSAIKFSKPVNHATRQPDGRMVAVAADDNLIYVMDGDSGVRIAQLHGHRHFSFATGWHPNGLMFATGSQDRTCRVWDVRNMSQSLSVLGAHMGAVRSLRFSSCGRFMVMAEPRDFVHVFDVNRGEFDTCQEIDLFGEIAGIALTPESEGLYIAVSDRLYSSLLEFERRSPSTMLDIF